MKLIVKYGKRFEINRIKSTLKKLQWYVSNGHKPSLPKNVRSAQEITKFIEKSFCEADYKNKGEELVKQFKTEKSSFMSGLKSIFKKDLPTEIEVVLTKYGTGGSYSLPNKVIVNIQGNQIKKPMIKVLKHEIIHLLVEEKARKENLLHQEKERLVNSIEQKFDF